MKHEKCVSSSLDLCAFIWLDACVRVYLTILFNNNPTVMNWNKQVKNECVELCALLCGLRLLECSTELSDLLSCRLLAQHQSQQIVSSQDARRSDKHLNPSNESPQRSETKEERH